MLWNVLWLSIACGVCEIITHKFKVGTEISSFSQCTYSILALWLSWNKILLALWIICILEFCFVDVLGQMYNHNLKCIHIFAVITQRQILAKWKTCRGWEAAFGGYKWISSVKATPHSLWFEVRIYLIKPCIKGISTFFLLVALFSCLMSASDNYLFVLVFFFFTIQKAFKLLRAPNLSLSSEVTQDIGHKQRRGNWGNWWNVGWINILGAILKQ